MQPHNWPSADRDAVLDPDCYSYCQRFPGCDMDERRQMVREAESNPTETPPQPNYFEALLHVAEFAAFRIRKEAATAEAEASPLRDEGTAQKGGIRRYRRRPVGAKGLFGLAWYFTDEETPPPPRRIAS